MEEIEYRKEIKSCDFCGISLFNGDECYIVGEKYCCCPYCLQHETIEEEEEN